MKERQPGQSIWRWVEGSLWVLGLTALGYSAYLGFKAEWGQLRGAHELEFVGAHTPGNRPAGSVVGRLAIPRLDLSVVIFEGTDSEELDRGAGHLTGSALPGGGGNVVLAAHRDTFFRALAGIRAGDVIDVNAPPHERTYVVQSTEIVNPNDLRPVRPTSVPTLTLVTCYPFRFIGSAPLRFIVRAVIQPRL